MPRHAGYLDLAFRIGLTVMGKKRAGDWRWSIEHSPFDIVAWRPAA
jgi:homogentisate 1,2-dioxygenase